MANELFVMVVGGLCALALAWGFTSLAKERWQILATLPLVKDSQGRWQGLNITWYGVISASSLAAASLMVVVMMGAVGASLTTVAAVMLPLISLSYPAARLVARVVEGKSYTFTVAGAFFVGLLAAPWLVLLVRQALGPAAAGLPPVAACAAVAAAYCFGEGLGRLACISFGCCYGKPLAESPRWMRRLFAGRGFVFRGATKKASYEGRLEGTRLVPIQAVTAVIYVACGLASLHLFLSGLFGWALMCAITVTQGWRAVSEVWRADYRGGGRISAYQWMALAAIAYAAAAAWLLPGGAGPAPQAARGLALLWNPGVLLVVQALWLGSLLYTGRSRVTGSLISFHVVRDRI
jgi:prolipoprotein diacylglyceryltransferase